MRTHKTLYAALILALLLSFVAPRSSLRADAIRGVAPRISHPHAAVFAPMDRQALIHPIKGNTAQVSARTGAGASESTVQGRERGSGVGPAHHERHVAAVAPRDATNCDGLSYLDQNGTQYTLGNNYVYWTFDFDPSSSGGSGLGFPGDLYYDAYGGCSYSYTNIEGSIALSFVENGIRQVYGTPNGEYGSWWSSNAANIPAGTLTDSMVPLAVRQDSALGQDPLVVTFQFLAGDAHVDWTMSVGGTDKSVPYSVKVTAPGDASISDVLLYHVYDLDDLNGGDSSPGADGQYLGGLLGSVYSVEQGIGISGYNAQWDLSTEDGGQQSADDTFQKVIEGVPLVIDTEPRTVPTSTFEQRH